MPNIPFKICFYPSKKKPLIHKNMQIIPYNIEYSFASLHNPVILTVFYTCLKINVEDLCVQGIHLAFLRVVCRSFFLVTIFAGSPYRPSRGALHWLHVWQGHLFCWHGVQVGQLLRHLLTKPYWPHAPLWRCARKNVGS